MEFNQKEFNKFVEENNVYGFFSSPITLKSGRKSHFYANWRTVTEDVWLTDRLAEHLISFIRKLGLKPDTIYAVPDGATKLGIISQYKWAQQADEYGRGSHVLSMGRKVVKEHGDPKDKYFLGKPKGRIVVVEDVTTTGGSLLDSLGFLKQSEVVGVISLTNRMEKRSDGMSVEQALQDYRFYSMSSALDILPVMYAKLNPGVLVAEAIKREFIEYGVRELVLK